METDHHSKDTGGRIPFWIWTLAGCALAGGALVLGLLTGHLLECERIGKTARDQRRRLHSISATLHQPISALEQMHESIFRARHTGSPSTDSLPSWTLDRREIRDLPPAVQRQLHRVEVDFDAAVEQIEDCRRWRERLGQVVEARQYTKQHAEDTLHLLRQRVREALAVATPGTLATQRQIEDALHEIDKQILSVAEEQNERRLRKLRDQRMVGTLDYLGNAIDALRGELGEEAHAGLRSSLGMLGEALLGSAGPSPPEVARTGFVAAHRAWLLRVARGESLDRETLGRMTKLRESWSGLDQLMGRALLEAQKEIEGRLHDLWVQSLAVGIAMGILFLLCVASTSRRARAQIHRLVETQRHASEAARAQGLFLASMSHEIRTPMNGVLGMAELLESSPLHEEHKQIARTIRTSAEALLTVINDVLDFSKIQAGKLELDATDFDLRNTVEDTLDLLGHLAAAKGIELLSTIDHRVPRFVHGDAGRLRQILLNLTGNAVKFTHEGRVTVLVDLLGTHGDFVRLQVAVSDTGIGIPEEAQPRLFKAFSQAEASTTQRFGGTGLGLTIAKRLIQLMGGDISVHSLPGVGSTFTFTLTLHRARSPAPREAPADLSGRAVLVVDDDQAEREALAGSLARWRMGFDVAESGDEALRILHEARRCGHSFDLCLIDLQMPGMDGLELARRIADDPDLAATRRVLLSSGTGRPAGRSLEECRLDAWLSKPAPEQELRDCVQSVLGLAPAPSSPGAGGEADADAPLRCHVLVAEDNAINQRVLQEMLRRLGCTIDYAANGAEAVEMVAGAEFDVVLMDCQMPELDGFAATRAIRDLPGEQRHVPIIALTANVLPADRRACKDAGMNDFLGKPVKKDELRSAIAQWAGAGAGAGGAAE